MRHQAEDVARGVDDAGDVAQRAVGIGFLGGAAGGVDVAQDDLVVVLELLQRPRVGDVAALAVLDRQVQHLAWRQPRVNGVSVSSTRTAPCRADEAQAAVADQRAGQQAGLAENLEAVADARAPGRRRARSATMLSMTGEKRAIAPERR